MSYAARRREGPLTDRQHEILRALSEGRRQADIARELGVTAGYISAETCVLVAKLGVRTSQGAAARYGSYRANMAAAVLIEQGRIPVPVEEGEVHVNHVLTELARQLRGRAERLLGAP